MAIRRFSEDRLALCAKWFDLVETDEEWIDRGKIDEGESQAIRIESAVTPNLFAAAKPGEGAGHTDTCRAAHEKLAFDLAHVLELPIPPVVLWPKDAPGKFPRGRAISAWAYRQSLKWNEAQAQGIISEDLKNSAGPLVSAMRVFHTWISDTDRKSEHTQVNVDSEEGALDVALSYRRILVTRRVRRQRFELAI
jgi:hypothetical protein